MAARDAAGADAGGSGAGAAAAAPASLRRARAAHPAAGDECDARWVGNKLTDALRCVICLDALREASTVKACGHTFCKQCFLDALRGKAKNAWRCPLCCTKLSKAAGSGAEKLLTPNFTARAALEELRCRCRFGLTADGDGWAVDADGCPAVLPLADVTAHEATCGYQFVTCENASLLGARCGAEHRRRDGAAHAAACPLRTVPCASGCGAKVTLPDMAAHAMQCLNVLVQCEYYGCGATVRRGDLAAHDKKRQADHLRWEREAREAYASAGGAAAAPAVLATASSAAAASAEDVEQALAQLLHSGLPRAHGGVEGDALIGLRDAALRAMTAHAAAAGVQVQGLRCLRHFMPRVSSYADVPSSVLAAMRGHIVDERIQQLACAALAAGARHHKTFCAGLGVDAVAAVLAAMDAHAASRDMQHEGCAVLISIHMDTLIRFSQGGGDFAPVVAALRAHGGAADVQALGCKVLADVATALRPKEDLLSALVAAGALQGVLDAMRAHLRVASVCVDACEAVCRMTAPKEQRVRAVGMGAFESLVAALQAKGAHKSVAIPACEALGHLSEGMDQDATGRAGRSGAIEAAARALHTHAADAGAVGAACKALRYLSCCEGHRVKAGAAGAVEELVAALNRFAASPAVVECVGEALSAVVGECLANCTKAVTAGAMAAVVRILRRHPAEASMISSLCLTISKLANCNAAKEGAADIIELLVAAMQTHSTRLLLQCFACFALCNFCNTHAELRSHARGAGAAEAVNAALVVFRDCEHLSRAAQRVLAELSKP